MASPLKSPAPSSWAFSRGSQPLDSQDTVLVAGGLVDLLLSMGGEGQQDMVTLRFVSALRLGFFSGRVDLETWRLVKTRRERSRAQLK